MLKSTIQCGNNYGMETIYRLLQFNLHASVNVAKKMPSNVHADANSHQIYKLNVT